MTDSNSTLKTVYVSRIPEDLWLRTRVYAAGAGISMRQVVMDALEAN